MPAQKILIFGGSFSPPTLAHEAIIARCLQLPGFDEVWVMPSGDRLDKTIPLHDDARLALLEIVKSERFADDPRLHISRFEMDTPGLTNTFDTWHALRQQSPEYDFWFVFGRDSYRTMPAWPHGDELRRVLSMVIFGDDAGEIPQAPNVQYVVLDAGLANVSATQVRTALAQGQPITRLVSAPVAGYLQRFTSGFPARPARE